MSGDLIDRLSQDLKPVRHGVVLRRLTLALVLGGVLAFAGVDLMLGLRPDLAAACLQSMFWIKFAYTGGLALLGVWCAERLSRPGGAASGRIACLALPLGLIGALAVMQLLKAPPALRHSLIMGASAAVCPWCILASAVPLYAALVWAIRGLAPTRLRLAGAVAGLTAGGAGASVYALHCPESAAPFIAVWYTLGIALAGGIGALVGPRLLRW